MERKIIQRKSQWREGMERVENIEFLYGECFWIGSCSSFLISSADIY